MPPFVSRKRTSSPAATSAAPPSKRARGKKSPGDIVSPRKIPSAKDNEAFIAQISAKEDQTSNESNSDAEEVEESPRPQKRRKVEVTKHEISERHYKASDTNSDDAESEDDEDDEHDAWSNFVTTHNSDAAANIAPTEDLKLTLEKAPDSNLIDFTDAAGKNKGPSRIQRQIRTHTHCMHVQLLMFHNALRNSWICDSEVQKTLVDGLNPYFKDEVARWRKACGITIGNDVQDDDSKSKTKAKGKSKGKKHPPQRDWGQNAERSDVGEPDLSQGDPTLRLLKSLSTYWRKKWTTTSPGLRKNGHKSLRRLEQEVNAWRESPENQDDFGERVTSLQHFRTLAKKCEGSRDIGAQLFTALLRGLGIEARLVASLQPIGFGWNKSEDASPAKPIKSSATALPNTTPNRGRTDVKPETPSTGRKGQKSNNVTKDTSSTVVRRTRVGNNNDLPIDLDSDISELTSPPESENEDDDSSVIDVTPKNPIQVKRYDRDLAFPTYWTEVLGVSQNWISVDPIVLSLVANTSESQQRFEPRGKQADRTKQVIAYVVAHSADGTAKDVTTRYLKSRMWPGKTRAVRLPVEKIPVATDRKGKVLKREEYDWFKRVMAGYTRSSEHRTAADDVEDNGDLWITKRSTGSDKPINEETLQGYKSSAEFVLERHLRREEALLPGTKPVKQFTTGKGDKEKTEPVYRRIDVVDTYTVESWHKKGRQILSGQTPLKHVPMRAVTTIRKREIEEVERANGGEKLKQPLYSLAQTELIVPPPIEDGVIPKNAFGNMDVYLPTMVPRGAKHLRLKGSAKVCKRLGIDYAEACTGFEFGNRMAVPVLTGVVVARENEQLVVDAWKAEEVVRKEKERAKREKLVLTTWKRLLIGLRVVERMKREYGDHADAQVEHAIKAEESKNARKTAASNTKQSSTNGKSKGKGKSKGESESIHVKNEEADLDESHGPGGFFLPGQDDEYARTDALTIEDYSMTDASTTSKPHTKSNGSHRQPQSLKSLAALEADEDGQEDVEDDAMDLDDSSLSEPVSTPPRAKKGTRKTADKGRATKNSRKPVNAATSRVSGRTPDKGKNKVEASEPTRLKTGTRKRTTSQYFDPSESERE